MGKRCTLVLTTRVDELIIIVGMTSTGSVQHLCGH